MRLTNCLRVQSDPITAALTRIHAGIGYVPASEDRRVDQRMPDILQLGANVDAMHVAAGVLRHLSTPATRRSRIATISIGTSDSATTSNVTTPKLFLIQRQIAESIAAEQEQRHPGHATGNIESLEAQVRHAPDAGDERRERAHDRA